MLTEQWPPALGFHYILSLRLSLLVHLFNIHSRQVQRLHIQVQLSGQIPR